MDRNSITATPYHTNPAGIHYLKVEMLGMFITNITVRESPNFPERGLWVQMPSFLKNGTYKKVVEFLPDSPLKAWIEEACIEAVKDLQEIGQPVNVDNYANEDELMSQEAFKKELDKLPF
jgi:hypothetical protein